MSGPTVASQAVGWDDPKTAHYYEQFGERHDRYRRANEALVAHAALGPGQRVLDVGAGTGGTAELALPYLGSEGRIVCLEPAHAMRARGKRRLRDPRVTWGAGWPEPPSRFDRILCGAAIWQLLPLGETFPRLRDMLAAGGALCFSIPALYLGEPDEPGGGRDPLLLELPALLAEGRGSTAPPGEPLPDAAGIEALLCSAGFRAVGWSFRLQLTQAEYRDWLKIPVLTDHLLGDLDPEARAELIDRAFERVDRGSWRWERWRGWTAWAM